MDEIRKLRKQLQDQTLKVGSMNKLLEEKQDRIRALEQERLSTMTSAGAPSSGTGADRDASLTQTLRSRVTDLQRLLEERDERIRALERDYSVCYICYFGVVKRSNFGVLDLFLLIACLHRNIC